MTGSFHMRGVCTPEHRLPASGLAGDHDRARALGRVAQERASWASPAHERAHQSRYADRVVPNPLPPRRAKLRLVK
jgi:hypothetical protein